MLSFINENQPVRSYYQPTFGAEENAIQPASNWTRAQTVLGIALVALVLMRLFKWPKIYIYPNPLKGENAPDSEFDPTELEKGTEVEMEHTTKPLEAKAIAKAHLIEDPDYYIKLANMESGACDCLHPVCSANPRKQKA